MASMGGYMKDGTTVEASDFYPISDTNAFLSSVLSNYSNIWRNFGIMWVFIISSVVTARG